MMVMMMTGSKVVRAQPGTLTAAPPSGTVGRNILHVTAASFTHCSRVSVKTQRSEVSLRAHLLEGEAGHLAVTWQFEQVGLEPV